MVCFCNAGTMNLGWQDKKNNVTNKTTQLLALDSYLRVRHSLVIRKMSKVSLRKKS